MQQELTATHVEPQPGCVAAMNDLFLAKYDRCVVMKTMKAGSQIPLVRLRRARPCLYCAAPRGAGANATFSGVICSIDLPLTCTKLNSRAASSAFTVSFTFDRAMRFPKNTSRSACSIAVTQSTYFETSADSASGTDSPTPSFTASGAQRYSTSQTEPSFGL